MKYTIKQFGNDGYCSDFYILPTHYPQHTKKLQEEIAREEDLYFWLKFKKMNYYDVNVKVDEFRLRKKLKSCTVVSFFLDT